MYGLPGFVPVIALFFIMWKCWRCPNCGSNLRGLAAGSEKLRHCEHCGEEIDLDRIP